jgi:RNA polymerase sporulation-specific sigma factor
MDEVIDLIIKIRNNDGSSFEVLCEKYRSLLDSMSKKYSSMYPDEVNEGSVRDDFSQEARLAFYNACLNYDINNGKVTFGAFAKTCIRNRLISYLRYASSKKRRKSKSSDVEEITSLQDTVIQRELEQKLISLAEKVLSNYELRIFRMYAQGAKAKEISAKIGKDEKSVNNAIFRIRSKLKKQSNINT